MRESAFKKKVMVFLKTLPCSWWVSVQQVSIRGTPDIIGCFKGQMYGLELKASDGATIAPLQLYTLKKIQDAEGVGVILHPGNFEEFKKRF